MQKTISNALKSVAVDLELQEDGSYREINWRNFKVNPIENVPEHIFDIYLKHYEQMINYSLGLK